jgi:nucleotide-binding universal stress UspA family protein
MTMEHPMRERKIVLGYDGSEGAKAALDWCGDHAPDLGAEVIVVGAVAVVPLIGLPPASSPVSGAPAEGLIEAMQEIVAEAVTQLQDAGVSSRTVVAVGHPTELLNRVALEESADLIVVGRRGHGGFAEMLLGSVAHSLAHHATRPLVIVPREDA